MMTVSNLSLTEIDRSSIAQRRQDTPFYMDYIPCVPGVQRLEDPYPLKSGR